MQKPLRIGVLGAAKIAPFSILAAARDTGVAEVVMVASRDLSRAEVFAKQYGIAHATDSYSALVTDERIDAVYNVLPPSLHTELTIQALEAGKAVLCEKPFCITAAEARSMVEASERTGSVLMEAMHARYHPQMERVREIVRSGEIGRIEKVIATFDSPIPLTPTEFRHIPQLGGGALLDTGVYCLSWCRSFDLGEPEVVAAHAKISEAGVDEVTAATLCYPSGATAEVYCGITGPIRTQFELIGSKATLKVRNAIAPQFFPSVIQVGDREESVTSEATYNFQLRAFAEAVRTKASPLMSARSSLAQMELLEAVRLKSLVTP